jgi:hypothetical protein
MQSDSVSDGIPLPIEGSEDTIPQSDGVPTEIASNFRVVIE